jgi:hypothetical protein
MQDRRDEPIGANPNVARPDYQVVCLRFFDGGILVCADPSVLVVPTVHEQADGSFHQLRQIPVDEPRVLPGEFDLARKRQIITDEDL